MTIKIPNIFALIIVFAVYWVNPTYAQEPFQYISPHPNATLVSAQTTIAIRHGNLLNKNTLSNRLFIVKGKQSGLHTGQVILAPDQKTVIFKSDTPFTAGETVHVTVQKGLTTIEGKVLNETRFSFTISPKSLSKSNKPLAIEDLYFKESSNASTSTTNLAQNSYSQIPPSNNYGTTITPPVVLSGYVTIPTEFPAITLTISTPQVDEGYIFVTTFRRDQQPPDPYLLILENTGEPVYYKRMSIPSIDFKKQPNGWLTYFNGTTRKYEAMDSTYTVIDSFEAGNGYQTDFHDLQLLPNGHALLMIYDDQPVDMSVIVPGGVPTATVVGLIIQELDVAKNVVFEWRSWDHFFITDTTVSLTQARIDYVHGNAVELDDDGNLLISCRDMDEVTKIDRQSGEIIWRLGGKNNQFTITNVISATDDIFIKQHDIRRLDNGNISVFDNRLGVGPPNYSRAIEYELDETNKIAKLVWEYRNEPDTHGHIMGSSQKLPNNNTLIGWGSGHPSVTEVTPDGDKVFELVYMNPVESYRAFRFPWEGFPTTEPTLVVKTETPTITLFYSWNGATNVIAYRIYGDKTLTPTTLIDIQPKTGFETKTIITDMLDGPYNFRVEPIFKYQLYLPIIFKPI